MPQEDTLSTSLSVSRFLVLAFATGLLLQILAHLPAFSYLNLAMLHRTHASSLTFDPKPSLHSFAIEIAQ